MISQKILRFLGRTLADYVGNEEEQGALQMLTDIREEVKGIVQKRINEFRTKFEYLSADERTKRREDGEAKFQEVTFKSGRVARVAECPACQSNGARVGIVTGSTPPKLVEDGLVIHRSVTPIAFRCRVCGLTLDGYQELRFSGLGDQFTTSEHQDPVEYFGIDPLEYAEAMQDHYEGQYMNE